jgi:DNA topoisomerase-1
MSDAVYEAVNASITAGGYEFRASGMKLVFAGFTKIYDESAETVKEQSVSIPQLTEGETVKVKDIESKQNFTAPPSRYTEASLIKTMEENGIGRPSTYSPTISTILDRGYVVKDQKALKPTELGEIVNKMMSEHFKNIVDIEFTADMENKLDEIEDGRNWTDVLNDFYNPFKETLAKAEKTMEKVEIKDEETDVICDKCGRNMVIKQGRFGKFLACPGFPECRNTKTIAQETGVDCPACGGKILIKKSQKGKKYYGCENFPNCDFMLWDEPLTENCPKCNSILAKNIFRGKKTIRCINQDCDYERKEN